VCEWWGEIAGDSTVGSSQGQAHTPIEEEKTAMPLVLLSLLSSSKGQPLKVLNKIIYNKIPAEQTCQVICYFQKVNLKVRTLFISKESHHLQCINSFSCQIDSLIDREMDR
jgi:hypothetical protein